MKDIDETKEWLDNLADEYGKEVVLSTLPLVHKDMCEWANSINSIRNDKEESSVVDLRGNTTNVARTLHYVFSESSKKYDRLCYNRRRLWTNRALTFINKLEDMMSER